MGLDMYLSKETYVSHAYFGPTCPHHVRDQGYERRPDQPEAGDECIAFPSIEGVEALSHVKPERVKGIVEEIGYWRKANAIHDWFVQNVQDGRDECQRAYVDREKLKELLDTCKGILDTAELIETGETYPIHVPKEGGGFAVEERPVRSIKNVEAIKEALPTASGFFFGSTEYDEWYLQDLKHTVKVIEAVFAEDAAEMERTGKDYPSGDIYYQSSW